MATAPRTACIKGNPAVDERHYQFIGLIGFIIAGLFFVAVGIRLGDTLTIIGSLVWIAACVVWLIPALRPPED